MFRHYRVILSELVINTLPSYTSISNVAVGNTIYNQVFNYKLYYQQLHLKYLCNLERYDNKLPEDDTPVSKHLGV